MLTMLTNLTVKELNAIASQHGMQKTRAYTPKAQLIAKIDRFLMKKSKTGGQITYKVEKYQKNEGGESTIFVPPKVPFSIVDAEYDISSILSLDDMSSVKYQKILSVFFDKKVDINGDNALDYLGKIIKNKSNLFNMINNYTIIEKMCKKNAHLDVERLLHISTTEANELQLIVKNLGSTTMQKMERIPSEMLARFIKCIATLNANGFVHFDIKQDNVMLFNEILVLIDYGMSCVKEGLEERMIMMLSSKNGIATLYPFEVAYVNACHKFPISDESSAIKAKAMMKMFLFNGFCGVAIKIYKIVYTKHDEYERDAKMYFKDTYCVFGVKPNEYEIKRPGNGETVFVDKDTIIDNIFDCLSKTMHTKKDIKHHLRIDTFYIGLILVNLKNYNRIESKNIKRIISRCLTMDVCNRITTEELYESFSNVNTTGGRSKVLEEELNIFSPRQKATNEVKKGLRDIPKMYPDYFNNDFSQNKYIYAESITSSNSSDARKIIDNLSKLINCK